jgi:hypothetical protein
MDMAVRGLFALWFAFVMSLEEWKHRAKAKCSDQNDVNLSFDVQRGLVILCHARVLRKPNSIHDCNTV